MGLRVNLSQRGDKLKWNSDTYGSVLSLSSVISCHNHAINTECWHELCSQPLKFLQCKSGSEVVRLCTARGARWMQRDGGRGRRWGLAGSALSSGGAEAIAILQPGRGMAYPQFVRSPMATVPMASSRCNFWWCQPKSLLRRVVPDNRQTARQQGGCDGAMFAPWLFSPAESFDSTHTG